MPTIYTDIPHNFSEIDPFVITDPDRIVEAIYAKRKCYFYDTCSFRKHAHLDSTDAGYFLRYIRQQDGIILITRGILMELASHSGILNREYIQYIKEIRQFGIDVLPLYEEDLFSVMDVCFHTNAAINSYLSWAVRMIKGPVSTITETLAQNTALYDEVIKGKNAENQGIYARFFTAARSNKEADDNLGEELLAICLYILSHIPGEEDGKFCMITDDKGAAGKADMLLKKTSGQFSGKRIVIFSTPKLVQVLYREKILTDTTRIKAILSAGLHGNIVVLGTRLYDLRNREISLSCDELASLVTQPNGINITF